MQNNDDNNKMKTILLSGLISGLIWFVGFIIPPLIIFTPLIAAVPFVMTSLRFGVKAGLFQLLPIIGVAVLFSLVNPVVVISTSLMFILALLLPSAWLSRLYLSTKTVFYDEGESRLYYPTGRILAWSAGFSIILSVLLLGTASLDSPEGVTVRGIQFISIVIIEVLQPQNLWNDILFRFQNTQLPFGITLNTELDIANFLAYLIVISLVNWLCIIPFINFMIGVHYAHKKNWVKRPKESFLQIELPVKSIFILIGSALISISTSGLLQLIGIISLTALASVWVIQGLAVIHALMPEGAIRKWLIGLVYIVLVLFMPMGAFVIIIGFLDVALGIRKKMGILR